MSIYISLLRGINVSGQKKINMKELKALYESLNLENVATYIQSGNVVFSCTKHTKAQLSVLIESAILKKFGFKVPVLILTETALNNALHTLPFDNISAETQGSQIIFSFLSNDIESKKVVELESYLIADEELGISDSSNNSTTNIVYLHCPNGYGKTKLSNTFLEKKLNVITTSRNLKTVIKLCDLARECH